MALPSVSCGDVEEGFKEEEIEEREDKRPLLENSSKNRVGSHTPSKRRFVQ